MSMLTTDEKLQLIYQLVEKHGIKAYEIGENTDLNASGVHRILTGEVKKPRDKTLSVILEYIENKITGTEVDLVEEEKNSYKPEPKTVEKLIALEVKKVLRSEFAQIGDAIVNNFADLEEIKEDLDELKEIISKIQKALHVDKSNNT